MAEIVGELCLTDSLQRVVYDNYLSYDSALNLNLPNMFNNCIYWQNITCFILPFSMFLLSLRQNIINMSTIIGRKHEIEELERLYYSDRPEFVAVYGRRRYDTPTEQAV